MEKLLDEISPTGLRTIAAHDHATNRFVIRHQQDLEPHMEYAKALRNDSDELWRTGMKKGWVQAFNIPDLVVVELRQIGVDVFRAPFKDIIAGLKKLGKEHFITTTKRVA